MYVCLCCLPAVFQICTLFSRSLIAQGYSYIGHGNLQLLVDPHPCLLNSIVCRAWWVTCPTSLLPFSMLGLSPPYPICSIQFRPLPKPHIASGISYSCHSLCSSKSELLAAFSFPCDIATVIEIKTTLVFCQPYPPPSVILSAGDGLSSHFPSLPWFVLHPDQSSLHSTLPSLDHIPSKNTVPRTFLLPSTHSSCSLRETGCCLPWTPKRTHSYCEFFWMLVSLVGGRAQGLTPGLPGCYG